MRYDIDPLSRNIIVQYKIPKTAPDEVLVKCRTSTDGSKTTQNAIVVPFISDTALELADLQDHKNWQKGRISVHRSAGLVRRFTLNIWSNDLHHYSEFEILIDIVADNKKTISSQRIKVIPDTQGVVLLSKPEQVVQQYLLREKPSKSHSQWTARDNSFVAPKGISVEALTFPLDLTGYYAVYLATEPRKGVEIRLTGDDRSDAMSSPFTHKEVFWDWRRFDRQHVVIAQRTNHEGPDESTLKYIRLVPLTEKLVEQQEYLYRGKRDKITAGYLEPYTWAFFKNIQHPLQHADMLIAFKQAKFDITDIQYGRFGAKTVYETRVVDQLLLNTFGDPVEGNVKPVTYNVGKMSQYTNSLETELKYSKLLNMNIHANFGAGNSYPGTPLESEFSKLHKDWSKHSTFKFELSEVHYHMLDIYREMLNIGAPGISIDFCRYPDGADSPEDVVNFLRKLRALTNEFAQKRKRPVEILIRFPVKGVRKWEMFDYKTWIKEHLADYLCPSNIQGRHMHPDVSDYINAAKGSRVKVLPAMDGLYWGLPLPGMFLFRVKQLHDAGADGIYLYQADAIALASPQSRRYLQLMGSTIALQRWQKIENRLNFKRNKDIYISKSRHSIVGWQVYERMRIWLEGIKPGKLEMYIDDKLINQYDAPPYILGSEEYDTDNLVTKGKHDLLIRAEDGDGWLEKRFEIEFNCK